MASNLWNLVLLSTITLSSVVAAHTFNLEPPSSDNQKFRVLELPHRMRRVAFEKRPVLHVIPPPTIRSRPTEPIGGRNQGPIKRGGPPYVVIQPMSINKRPRAGRRLVLTLPKDNIQILNAEAVPDRGSQFYPTTFTLSLRDNDSEDHNGKESTRYSTTRSYASQIPSPPRQASRFHYGYMPMTHDSEEDRGGRKHGRWSKGEVTYEMDDLVGSSGGHVTVIKAHAAPHPKLLSARKVRGGSSVKAMKAIFIEPREIEAKRVTVVETNTEKISPTKARLVKAAEPMIIQGMKVKAHPAPVKHATITKNKGHQDWAASNLHFVNVEPPQEASGRHQEEDMPPMSELQCGGTNDLGWCDLGVNYPSTEVSQIMEVCEELVSRMYVEVPEHGGVMEDIASYSLSRNITENGPRAYWPWKDHVAHYKKPLCEVERDTIKPSFAQDIRGKWHVIIQTEHFPQRISLEVCSKPGGPCSESEQCNPARTQCVQKYSHHQLISFDPESAETCPYVRLYKFPTSCVCRTD